MSERMDRRGFIGTTAAAAAGLAALSQGVASAQGEGARARVVRVRRDNACVDGEPDEAVVKQMTDAAVMALSGKATPAEAWGQFIKPDDIVGIKINCLFGVGACTHAAVTAAVIAGCKAAGVADERIIVWDRTDRDLTKCGYEVNRGPGVKVYGVNADWEAEPVAIHTCQGRLAKVLTQTCTAIVNVPILKSHGLSGITASMKNHYGSFHNPAEAHDNGCDPYIAHVNNLAPIREKARLILCDALLPVADGGPQARPEWTWAYNAILAATDPVALDYTGLRILDEQRAKLGKPSLEQTGRAKHVFTAAGMGLGVAGAGRIELLEV